MPDATPYCTAKPVPGSYMSAPCPDCGHALLLHIGCEHCPVCEMVALNGEARVGQLARGEKSVNDQRGDLGLPTLGGEVFSPAPRVHYLPDGSGNCVTARMVSKQWTGGALLEIPSLPGVRFAEADPHAKTGDTWHYPCDKAEAPTEAEPDGTPTTVTIHVHGVLTERQLGEAIEKHILRAGMRAPRPYSKYTRR